MVTVVAQRQALISHVRVHSERAVISIISDKDKKCYLKQFYELGNTHGVILEYQILDPLPVRSDYSQTKIMNASSLSNIYESYKDSVDSTHI